MDIPRYDVAIVGAGVTGTALAYVLASYTNVDSIVLIEKESGVAEINSHPMNNSQTSHDGGTETNYNLEHALPVRAAAVMLRRYIDAKGTSRGLFRKTHRMVLGIGEDEVQMLKDRLVEFAPHYPDLHYADREELAQIEPKIVEGRDPEELIGALVSSEGYAVDYQVLARSFLDDVGGNATIRCDRYFGDGVHHIEKLGDGYQLSVGGRSMWAKTVVFAAGSYSLLFAQRLGYGTDLALLPIAGSFYSAGPLLNGKVYRVQIDGMPFAAIHGDPDVLGEHETRFGPTVKPLPLMERYHNRTVWDYLTFVSFRLFLSVTNIMIKRRLLRYIFTNTLYDLPWIGPRLFIKEARAIVPTLTHRDIKLRRGAGGIRPQIVDLRAKDFRMDETKMIGDNIIFNTTPSPGASVCLRNAKEDASQIVEFLGSGYAFDAEAFARDLE